MINILSKDVINKIAAGEVVERPASVVKELIENAIDAGADIIKIKALKYGTELIQIEDNGDGIHSKDFDKLFLRHATSKISSIDDLEKIDTMGFRGEALASIAAVSDIEILTRHQSESNGSLIKHYDGKITISPTSITKGTIVKVKNLFENIPARKKFLKSPRTENIAIWQVILSYVLSYPNIRFEIEIDRHLKIYPKSELIDRICDVTKIEKQHWLELNYDNELKIFGYTTLPKKQIFDKKKQYLFVNHRPIFDQNIPKAVQVGYGTFLMNNTYPGFVLFIEINPAEVDFNVHPRKSEIRFSDQNKIFNIIKDIISTILKNHLKSFVKDTIAEIKPENTNTYIQVKNPDFTIQEFEEFLKNEEKHYYNPENTSSVSEYQSKAKPNIKSSFLIDKAIEFNQNIYDTIKENTYQNDTKTDDTNLDIQNLEYKRLEKTFDDYDLSNVFQINNSYIVLSTKKSIVIIDQHAASERYFFEYFIRYLKSKNLDKQNLLVSEVIEFTIEEIEIIETNLPIFKQIGFDIEIIGKDKIIINAIPAGTKFFNYKKVIKELIGQFNENFDLEKSIKKIAATMACHTAIRFGDPLKKEEIIDLINKLLSCENPYSCPHGRPIIYEIPFDDLEKKFCR